MQFALAVPWWTLILLAAAIVGIAWASYAKHAASLQPIRATSLTALRALSLLILVACVLRPIRAVSSNAADAVLPILVDVSRSMSLEDVDGRTRLEAARTLVERDLAPLLRERVTPDVWTFGDELRRVTVVDSSVAEGDAWAVARRSDLTGALRQIRERYRDKRLAGVVVVSDGGETGTADAAGFLDDSVPVFTIGLGSKNVDLDYEVIEVAAGDATIADAAVDITVAAVSRGSDVPFDVRLLENGRPIDVRRVDPIAPGSPVRAVFTVSPATDAATLYTVEIPAAAAERVAENNRRSLAVEPPGRARRLLMIEGAPGFEHSFLKRALNTDRALEIDSIVRKGRDTAGNATFFVQAPAGRAELLLAGFPKNRAALYAYDAVILANVEPDALTQQQLEQLATFVEARGGGMLVLGAKSFAQHGLAGTPLEEVLPVTLSARSSGIVRAAATRERFGIAVTPEGAGHPTMRIAASQEDVLKRWQALPPLAGASPLGSPRPGALVLAFVRTPEGQRPLVAVQRYGQGRSMVFAGEASWRWRMMMPSSDRTYELFWRHAARWLSSSAPERLSLADVAASQPGDEAVITTEVRDAEFKPVAGATLALSVKAPSGAVTELRPTLADASAGRYVATLRFEESGIYRVAADARAGSDALARERWILVGAADREMSDPRLNEDVLRRISRASGGTYLSSTDVSQLPGLLHSLESSSQAPQVRELWHNAWLFVALVMLLSAEWGLRRAWGLR